MTDNQQTDEQTAENLNADELRGLVSLTLSETNGNAVLRIQVTNQPGYKLPATGGLGNFLFTLCGLGLMAGALMYSYYGHRKRGRRSE